MVVSDCFVCLLDLFLQPGGLILRAFIEVRLPTHSLIYTDWLISLSEEKPCWRSGGAEGEEKGFGRNWEEGMEGKL